MSLQDDLLAIEQALWTGGPEDYLAHCDATCMVLFAGMSKVMTREEIAATAEKGRWKSADIEPIGLVSLSDETAVIGYQVGAVRSDGQPHNALVSSAYIRREKAWKLAAHHQTELPGKESGRG